MAWKATGQPTVRQQRERWVVRVDGIDTETGKHRPRQLGTYPSRRAANRAASEFTAAGDFGNDRRTVGRLVDEWVASRTDIGPKTKAQYEWAAGHIRPARIAAGRSARTDRRRVPIGTQIGSGTRLNGTTKVFTTGTLEITERTLDVAIDGEGFFALTLPDGSTGYTRDGGFHTNAAGKLVTGSGNVLLPEITVPSDTLEISIDPKVASPAARPAAPTRRRRSAS